MADYQYIDATGTIVPDTETILTETQTEYKDLFGADLIVTADTPQGMLITAEALSRTEVVNNNAIVANQINPNLAAGVFLDNIAALTGIQRKAATKSVISGVVLSGVAGTIIPEGTQAQTTTGELFASSAPCVIGVGGTVAVDFASVEYGAVTCAANALTQIVTSILGWETVNNPNAATLGSSTQSDQSLRAYRKNTLAFQAVGLAEAITSALYAVEGVTSLAFRENPTASTATIDGISLVRNSIWACVQGGSNLDVAAALLENKSSGCAWNGATTVNVVEPASGQTYEVKFDRPTQKGVLIKVTTPNGVAANIKKALLDYAAGLLNGLDGFIVGADVLPFDLAGAIISQFPETQITKVEVSYSTSISWTTNVLAIALNEIAVTQDSYITVVAS